MATPPAPAPENQLVTGLAKLGLALRHEAWRTAGPRGLNPTQAQILVCLARGHAPRLQELARELGVTDATASDAVSALVQKELVRKTRSSSDARALVLELSAKGKREAARASQWPDHFLSAASTLSAEEQAVLLRSLTKIIRHLQLEGRIAVARMCASCTFFRPHAHRSAARPHHCAFVDAAFGPGELRLECADHEPVAAEQAQTVWERFASGGPSPD